jgi:transposase
LSCAVDTRYWTQEGTQKASEEKAIQIAKVITGTKEKGNLTTKQEDFIRKREKTLALLQNPFPRPSRPLYQGDSSILAGVSFGLDKPATLAIVDISSGKAITYRSIRQLLGDEYKLLNRWRAKQQRRAKQRRKNQVYSADNRINEGGLGDHIDSLIAKAIVEIAQQFKASSIVLPDLSGIREIIQSEIQAKAEEAIPELKEAQAKFAKDYRSSIHRWSYNRLIQKIQSQASQAGISVETAKQPLMGTPQIKARDVAIAGYRSRKAS